MIRMKYWDNGFDLNTFKKKYKSRLSSWGTIQDKWGSYRNKYILNQFPLDIEDVILASYEALADMYNAYIDLHLTSDKNDELAGIFNYEENKDVIADFFIDNAEELAISTCHYCEMAYINVFEENDTGRRRRQFDVEHVLDKAKCPLVALSLFNFVPSCQCCNSRIKAQTILGRDRIHADKHISPTSEFYQFDENVHIRVYPTKKKFDYMRMLDSDKDKFKLYFKVDKTTPEYKTNVDVFHLKERYSFHIVEALRLIQLYHKYPPSYLALMSNALGGFYTPAMIKEDIFAEEYTDKHRRVFAKLHRDISEQCTKATTYRPIIQI